MLGFEGLGDLGIKVWEAQGLGAQGLPGSEGASLDSYSHPQTYLASRRNLNCFGLPFRSH